MAEPQLSIRSARARDLAHRLARRENRTVVEVVERALEVYEGRGSDHESPADFYRRLGEQIDSDIDLDRVIREERKPYGGIDL